MALTKEELVGYTYLPINIFEFVAFFSVSKVKGYVITKSFWTGNVNFLFSRMVIHILGPGNEDILICLRLCLPNSQRQLKYSTVDPNKLLLHRT